MRHPLAMLVVALLSVSLAACGSSRDSDGSESTSSTWAASSSGSFGTLPSPCGDGDARGATDQGVTDDAIRIGYGDDAGFAAQPGLNHEYGDAVRALIGWCNDLGGINGRPVEGTYYDAKITEVGNVMTEACEKEFFLVGQLFALDSQAEPARRACGLPSVPGSAVSPPFGNGPRKFEPLPNPVDYAQIPDAIMLKRLFPDAIEQSAVLFANYPDIVVNKDKILPALEDAGFDFRCQLTYNVAGEADWKPIIQKLKDCDAQLVRWVGSPFPNFANALEAAAQLDYRPIWLSDPNAYDLAFAKWNTDGFGDRVYFKYLNPPFDEADASPATKLYLDLVERSGGDASGLAVSAASAFLLWATAADNCDADLTRDCVLGHLSEIHDWTAGGLQAPSDVGRNLGTECGLLMKLTGTSFERVAPKKPNSYECDPSFLVEVPPDPKVYELDADRIVQLK